MVFLQPPKAGTRSCLFSWRQAIPSLVPDTRGHGDSDKPAGTDGYNGRALAEEFRALVKQIDFGCGQKILLVAHDMGAHPALIWAADHPDEMACLVCIEVPPCSKSSCQVIAKAQDGLA